MIKSPGSLYSLTLQVCKTVHLLQNNEKKMFLKIDSKGKCTGPKVGSLWDAP